MIRLNIRLWLPLILVVFVAGCVPSGDAKKKSTDDIVIKQGVIGGKRYYVPEPYFVLKGDGITKGIYVRAMYPDFAPVTKSSKELWEEKQEY